MPTVNRHSLDWTARLHRELAFVLGPAVGEALARELAESAIQTRSTAGPALRKHRSAGLRGALDRR